MSTTQAGGGEHKLALWDELRAAGNAAFRAEDWAAAERLYTEAWEASEGRDALALCNRSAVRLRRGDVEGAAADAHEAVFVVPGYAKAHFRLAQALERAGAWREALGAVRACERLTRETGAVPSDVAVLRRRVERAWLREHYGPATAALGGRVVVRMCCDGGAKEGGDGGDDRDDNADDDRGKGVFLVGPNDGECIHEEKQEQEGKQQEGKEKQKQKPEYQPVKSGQIIFIEEPLVSHMDADTPEEVRARTCAQCMRGVLTRAHAAALLAAPVPGRALCPALTAVLEHAAAAPQEPLCRCPHCGTPYCSPACRAAAWTAHHCLLCPGKIENTAAKATETGAAVAAYTALAAQRGLTHPLCVARMAAGVAAAVLRDGVPLGTALAPYAAFEWGPSPVAEEERFCTLLARAMRGSALYRTLPSDGPDGASASDKNADDAKGAKDAAGAAVPDKDAVITAVTSREMFRMLHGVLQRNASRVQPVSTVHAVLAHALPPERAAELLGAPWARALAAGGTALFRVANTLNHSCAPNCQFASTTDDHRLAVVATRDIAPGEELLVSYIDETRPYAERQRELLQRYSFHCTCPKCLAKQ